MRDRYYTRGEVTHMLAAPAVVTDLPGGVRFETAVPSGPARPTWTRCPPGSASSRG
jgi:hypothetical protein